jgi:hypothetical protein
MDQETLFCPKCRGLPIEYDSQVELRLGWQLDERFTDENVVGLVKEYSKTNLILYLIHRLNHIANIHDKNGTPIGEYGYLSHFLKRVYENSGFGDEQLEDATELDEEIELVRDAYTGVIKPLEDSREKFVICIGKPDRGSDWNNFGEDYDLIPSEYKLCYDRCVKSVLAGTEENREHFNFISENFRDFDKTEPEDIEDSRDFADCWYELIQQQKFIASSDETVGDIFYTELPDSVNVFQLEELFDRIDSEFGGEAHEVMKQHSIVATPKTADVNQWGKEIFGDDWQAVKRSIIVSEDNLDAHPFLYQVTDSVEQMLPGGRTPRTIEISRLIYPRFWDSFLKFQVFPMLRNGDEPPSYELLNQLNGKRGDQFEEKIHEYLRNKGIESYLGAEITRGNPNEIDALVAHGSHLLFIELKFLTPPIRMNTATGIEELNQNFDYKVFKKDNGAYPNPPTGKPYPEKVAAWEDLEPGDSFWSETDGERTEQEFKEEWQDLNMEMLVVSNLVPSYVEKEGVRFLTDLEFYQWVEHGEDVFYKIE